MASSEKYPYKCEIEVTFPSPVQARRAKSVLEVDGELGDKVIKTFSLSKSTQASSMDSDDCKSVLFINFEATEARMLRVSLSSFYDALNVYLKCLQEFE